MGDKKNLAKTRKRNRRAKAAKEAIRVRNTNHIALKRSASLFPHPQFLERRPRQIQHHLQQQQDHIVEGRGEMAKENQQADEVLLIEEDEENPDTDHPDFACLVDPVLLTKEIKKEAGSLPQSHCVNKNTEVKGRRQPGYYPQEGSSTSGSNSTTIEVVPEFIFEAEDESLVTKNETLAPGVNPQQEPRGSLVSVRSSSPAVVNTREPYVTPVRLTAAAPVEDRTSPGSNASSSVVPFVVYQPTETRHSADTSRIPPVPTPPQGVQPPQTDSQHQQPMKCSNWWAEDDAEVLFGQFVTATLRSIAPDYRRDMAKLEIQQILIKHKHSLDVPPQVLQPSSTSSLS